MKVFEKNITSILFSTLPASPSHVWRKSTTPHSIFFNPPVGTPQEDAFWDSLLGSVPANKIIGVSFPFKQSTMHEMHLTDSTTCLDICSKGFLVNNEWFFPSQGIPTGTKILRLYLTKLPFLPRQDLEQLIKNSLVKYGIVHEIGIYLCHSCFDSTGYAYVKRPPTPTTSLLPLLYKIPTSDSTHFLAMWTRMGSHCTYCRAMGHDIKACPIRPQDSRKCFTCHKTSHLQNTCPRTPTTEFRPSKCSRKLPRTILSAQDPKTHLPPPPASHPDSAAQSKMANPLTLSLSETTQPKRTYATHTSPGIETANPFAVLAEIFKAAESHMAQTQEKSDTNPANPPFTPLYHNLQTAFIPEGSGSSPTILDEEFHKSAFDILALQETHAHTEDLQQTFTQQFQAKDSLWSPHCRLVSLSPFLSFTDPLFSLCGQCITATVVHSSNLFSPFRVCVLYAPATVRPCYDFLTSLLSSPHLVPSKPSQFLMLGDFNYASHTPPPRARLAPKPWLQFVSNTLVDCITPLLLAPMPTFHRDMSSSTIDYIYVSTDLAHCYDSSTITYVQPLWIDHCLVQTCLRFPTLSNIGKGLWRANLHLAHNPSFCSALSRCLTSFVPTLLYNSSPQIQWDLLKQKVAHFTRSFSRKSHPSLATLEVKLQKYHIHHSRSLSIRRRATILNTLVLSKLWHVLRVTTVPMLFFHRLCSIMSKFLQYCTFPSISLATLCQPLSRGGLGILNPQVQQAALQLHWLRPLILFPQRQSGLVSPWFSFLLRLHSHSEHLLLPLLFPPLHSPHQRDYNSPLHTIFAAIDILPHDFTVVTVNLPTCLSLPLSVMSLVPPNCPTFPSTWQDLRVSDAYEISIPYANSTLVPLVPLSPLSLPALSIAGGRSPSPTAHATCDTALGIRRYPAILTYTPEYCWLSLTPLVPCAPGTWIRKLTFCSTTLPSLRSGPPSGPLSLPFPSLPTQFTLVSTFSTFHPPRTPVSHLPLSLGAHYWLYGDTTGSLYLIKFLLSHLPPCLPLISSLTDSRTRLLLTMGQFSFCPPPILLPHIKQNHKNN
ncbi:CCHC-type zinc finger transcription factor [Phycomyces blakesleeanus NRRL 1555(-)]|uniref:CCHC-type zinc finger transcription factor n=1 Tax=Phycomyces blakesleeanus (strain ATCC 8743b / DSM 1359 / FGSC 10004 / NBRC 33097 / NRRL 1555) TaxID=763407 RepID=A0A162W8N7_PHYB8|nr:CCHC-type zinc finger transcription factor [Phycomyces blakesleeanus NRRL 1555(-)]OAD65395.1 CCHC-type zinc finger transcription factor [Phycomyces blakesleeanus NRRL 1555(-)]|eukprot:XP_018283435.1 CCHC-type zinc finger transcription factor [Phycomyces blakesleeanus NRRL 1555(-)]